MIIRWFTTAIICTLFSTSILFAEKDETAFEIVSCVNTTNGHFEPFRNTPWQLTQAVLGQPFERERDRLEEGFHIIHGRLLGYHATWLALLDLTEKDWRAFETRSENDGLRIFGASFVPDEIISALASCGVVWSGYWAKEYPFIDPTRAKEHSAQELPIYLWDVDDLMPPRPSKASDAD